ncbi:prepilin-type N-terminal cleavage/methylation domain-containing protein [Hydrogenibacillus sp. N12]|uniref:PulJ/GspJ family protein n=1 Tax=Hydrogenibacillus sp. N12 TaxID=2866627 RepID=UPI001C7D096F|nr:prepilin-type N-terminal cleavage/methylation domain-containing protein [Hydrogenibacillus sp. N12]QZA32930.1 prepilin-type N-terminal cleavage/methylation domain-containing protein [Hydrogenibacillus sp. N12]
MKGLNSPQCFERPSSEHEAGLTLVELLAALSLSAVVMLASTFIVLAVGQTQARLTRDLEVEREVDAITHMIERQVKDATRLEPVPEQASDPASGAVRAFRAVKEENAQKIVRQFTLVERGLRLETWTETPDNQQVNRHETTLPLRFCSGQTASGDRTSFEINGGMIALNLVCQTDRGTEKRFFRVVSVLP